MMESQKLMRTKPHNDNDKWIKDMESEINSLIKNGTYELVKLLKGGTTLKTSRL